MECVMVETLTLHDSIGNYPRNNSPLLCFSIKIHTQGGICTKLFFGRFKPLLKKKKQGTDIVGFLICFFGHQCTSLSAIRPSPAHFAFFFPLFAYTTCSSHSASTCYGSSIFNTGFCMFLWCNLLRNFYNVARN